MLTETEKRFVQATTQPGCPQFGWDINNPFDQSEIRERMLETAIHEAGHFAARCFTDMEVDRVVSISIIPNKSSLGRMSSERPLAKLLITSSLPEIRRPNGINLLLETLAGYGANILAESSGQWDSIWEYWFENCFEDDEAETDMSSAIRTAEILASPYMPARRILRLADRWTLEMLTIPAIWEIVKTISNRLIQYGELTRDDLVSFASDHDWPTVIKDTKWRRRVLKI